MENSKMYNISHRFKIWIISLEHTDSRIKLQFWANILRSNLRKLRKGWVEVEVDLRMELSGVSVKSGEGNTTGSMLSLCVKSMHTFENYIEQCYQIIAFIKKCTPVI